MSEAVTAGQAAPGRKRGRGGEDDGAVLRQTLRMQGPSGEANLTLKMRARR